MKGRFDLWHPSRHRLRLWLLTGEPEGVARHVEQCERCAARLEELDDDEPVLSLDGPAPLRQALVTLLAPPDDLSERVTEQVELRSRLDGGLELFAGLFAIGVETAQLMVDLDTDQDRDGDAGASTDRHTPESERPMNEDDR